MLKKEEKILVRGLVKCAGWIFLIWGIVIALKGMYDSFWGEPEANYFSPEKWDFITQAQWIRYAGFEILYGLACVGVACALWKYASYMPEYYVRTNTNSD